MVTMDFGNYPGINMQNPGAMSTAVLSDFPDFNFLTGFATSTELHIPNSANGWIVRALGAFAYEASGRPTSSSRVTSVEIFLNDADGLPYRFIMLGTERQEDFNVSFTALESALLNRNLSSLYNGYALQVLGTQTYGDTLVGGALADALYGYGGNDRLIGSFGNDSLDGMGGRDTMSGGAGNDDYYVNAAGDRIEEGAGQGIDLAIASIDYTLPKNVEDLSLHVDFGAIDGTGNTLANFMVGNYSANRLEGLSGNDTIDGYSGNDVLDGGGGNDTLVGSAGNDRLLGGAGVDRLSGAGELDTLDGGTGNDFLLGGDGDDSLNGGAGVDRLAGGNGNDVLVWDETDEVLNAGDGARDVLRLLSGDLDLRAVANGTLLGIERIDMTGGSNTLTLNRQELLDISSSTNTLWVLGEAGDTVNVPADFIEGGEAMGFTRYQSGAAVLWVDSDITVT